MLDRNHPYEQVFGIPGVTFSQGGHLFNTGGHPVTYRREKIGVDEKGEPTERLIVERVTEAAVVVTPEPGGDFEGMHWKTLAAMLNQYDQPFTTREAAIAFLRGRA